MPQEKSGAMQSAVKPPSFGEAVKRITELRRIDLRKVSIEFLKDRLELLFLGYFVGGPTLPEMELYRGVRWQVKPNKASQLTYAPAHYVTAPQRVNRENTSMFYGAADWRALFHELKTKPGDQVAISKWRTKKNLLIQNLGFTREVFTELKANRAVPDWVRPHHPAYTPTNRVIAKFFSDEFSRLVQDGDEHLYKMSIAIAEKHYIANVNLDNARHLYDGEAQFSGLLYPSIATLASTDNIALLPYFADKYLELRSVQWFRVETLDPSGAYKVTLLDFADSFGNEGVIEWKDRLPQWVIPPGASVVITGENGHYVMTDPSGKVIAPT